MSHIKDATQQFRAIPPERLTTKIKRTIVGAGIIACAVFAGRAGWPWYAVLGIGGVGAHVLSAELVEKAGKWAVALIRDVLKAVAGKNGP